MKKFEGPLSDVFVDSHSLGYGVVQIDIHSTKFPRPRNSWTTINMEAANYSKSLVPAYQSTRRYIPENFYVYEHCFKKFSQPDNINKLSAISICFYPKMLVTLFVKPLNFALFSSLRITPFSRALLPFGRWLPSQR